MFLSGLFTTRSPHFIRAQRERQAAAEAEQHRQLVEQQLKDKSAGAQANLQALQRHLDTRIRLKRKLANERDKERLKRRKDVVDRRLQVCRTCLLCFDLFSLLRVVFFLPLMSYLGCLFGLV